MSVTFPSADRRSRRPAAPLVGRLFRRWDETVREVADRDLADGALREFASQKR
jgi:hypothetical protein